MIRRLATILAFGAAALVLVEFPARGADTERRPFGVIDLHVDLSYEHNYKGHPFADGTGQFRAAELARAGVVGVVLPLYVPRRVSPTGPRLSDFESSYAKVYGALAATEPYRLPGCLPRNGGVRTWLAFEGAGAFAGDTWVETAGAKAPVSLVGFAARGVRVFGPVHAFANELASSSGDAKPADFGLTPSGRDVLRAAFADINADGGLYRRRLELVVEDEQRSGAAERLLDTGVLTWMASGTPDAAALIAQGDEIYNSVCVACHQPEGAGFEGIYPALAGDPFVTLEDPAPVIRTVLQGRGGMPSFRNAYDDEEIAAVLSYIRQAWGNNAGPVTPDQVAEIRAQVAATPAPQGTPLAPAGTPDTSGH